VQRQLKSPRLCIGVFLAILLPAAWCAGQYAPGNNGLGNTPMEPAAPGSGSMTMPGLHPPTAPTSPERASSWPGAALQSAPGIRQISRDEIPPANQLQLCSTSRRLAMVGGEPILESDVIGFVNRVIEANKEKIPPEQYAKIREDLIKRQLNAFAQNKQVFLDAKNSIPAEHWPNVEKQVAKIFEENELPKLMRQEGVDNRRDLEAKLHALGSSLDREKRAFLERELAAQWVQQQIKRDEEITYDQMVAYYHRHQNEFSRPAKAKWEEIAVRVSKYASEAEAKNAIARLGNQVVLGGAAFADVAKKSSDGVTASAGGRWDWTSKGSLMSKEIDEALFTLPVGQLSPILRSENYFQIIRVTEREEAGIAPFLDAQVEIREKIVRQRFEKQRNEYLAKVAAKIPITTIYDAPAAPANPQTAALPQPPLQ